jgi:hypothetical protein
MQMVRGEKYKEHCTLLLSKINIRVVSKILLSFEFLEGSPGNDC